MTRKILNRAPILLAVVLGVFGVMHGATAQALEESDCSTLSGEAAASCREALPAGAGPNVFLRLGDLLLQDRNFFLAVKVYRRGVRLHPEDSELRAKLTVAESGLDEAQWIELRRQESAALDDAATKADIFKCTRLAESAPQTALQGCEAALAAVPDDPELLEAKGDALRRTGNNTEAYRAYDAASRQAPSPALEEKLAALAEYKPEPAPTPVVEPEPDPAETETAEAPEEQPVQTARAAPEAAPESETASTDSSQERREAAEQDREKQAVDKAALIRTITDRGVPLNERLKARNMLMSMARQTDDSG